MFKTYANNSTRAISGIAAVVVVAFAALVLDQAHLAAAPLGTVEIGELTPIGLEKLAQATLPGITVTAERPAASTHRFASTARARRAGGAAATVLATR